MKLVNEVLGGIRVIKMYAWEKPYLGFLLGARSRELEVLRKIQYTSACMWWALSCYPLFWAHLIFSLTCCPSTFSLFSISIHDSYDCSLSVIVFSVSGGLLLGTTFFWSTSPVMVSLATFALYVLTGHELTADKAFVALSLFNLMQFPVSMLPFVIRYWN